MKKYKLVTQDLKTRVGESNQTQWEIGVFQPELKGEGDLCTENWYHYYHHPLLAAFLNPAYSNIDNPRCFTVDALGKHIDDNGRKGGCTKMRLVSEVPFPVVTQTQKTALAILSTKEVYKDHDWNTWADNWLSGKNRSDAYAFAAAYATVYAAASATVYAAASAKWKYKKLLSMAKKAMKY